MHRMKQQDTRLQRGRPVAWSFGAAPTSSPASSTPRCAASGLDLGPAPKARHPCRRHLALSFARKRRSLGCMDARQGNRAKEDRVKGFAPETPPRGSAPWNPAKGGALGTHHLVGRWNGGQGPDVPRFTIAVDAACSPLAVDQIAAAKSECGLFPCLTGGVRSRGHLRLRVHRGSPLFLRGEKAANHEAPAIAVSPPAIPDSTESRPD